MAKVTLTDIKKSYSTVEVLHDISIDIPDGSFITFVGPSGCGKSTLLRMIAGLETITSGEIAIGDTVVNDIAPRDRDIAMVFQNYALYPHMNVAENMGFSMRLRKKPKPEIQRTIDGVAKILGLEALLDRYPAQLSGGQRQRVAMGRAIVRAPQVFLFDEPLSNLDAKLRGAMRTEIKALHQRLGTTMIYVTHDQIEALTLADHMVVMDKGYISQFGSPLSVYDRPANLFVAAFIGSPSMNFIHGTLTESRQEVKMRSGRCLPLVTPVDAQAGSNVVYGIRPADISLDADGIPVSVKVVEPTGAETLINASLDGEEFVLALRERVSPDVGEALNIMPVADRAHLFDAASGLRLN